MSSINIAKMSLFKIFTIILISIFLSGSMYADSDRDASTVLDKEIEQLRTQLDEETKQLSTQLDELESTITRLKNGSDISLDEETRSKMLKKASDDRYKIKEILAERQKLGYIGLDNFRIRLAKKALEENRSQGNRFKWSSGYGAYIAKSVDEYVEICQSAFDCLAKFSPKLSRLGRDVDEILSFYTRLSIEAADKDGKFTLNTFRLQRAYVAFKKVVKACALNRPITIGPYPVTGGTHNEFSPILGIKADSMQLYTQFAKQNSEFLRFGKSI